MEDFSPPLLTPADFTNKYVRDETEEENDHDDVSGCIQVNRLVKERRRFIPVMKVMNQ